MTSTVWFCLTTAPVDGSRILVRVLSIAHGLSTLTFGSLPYAPVTVTLSKLFDGLTGLGLGVGVGVVLGVAEGVLLGVVALAEGEVEGEGDAVSLSSPQAASSIDDVTPATIRALAGKERTGKPYPDSPAPTGGRQFPMLHGKLAVSIGSFL